MRYMTPQEAAAKWGISRRRVNILCAQGRIPGVERHGGIWLIPEETTKPKDRRVKTERYITEPCNKEQPPARPGQQIPEPPANVISHPQLLAKIAPPGKKLTFIHAGAGYGKTTLLAQYAKGRQSLCWLSMEGNGANEHACDLPTFLCFLEDTLRAELPQLAFHAGEYRAFAGEKKLIPLALSVLLQAIGSARLTLILDDVHAITDEMVIAFLVELVKRCPENITLIMTGRHELWSDLYRLQLDGAIAEVTKEDLCFSRETLLNNYESAILAENAEWAASLCVFPLTFFSSTINDAATFINDLQSLFSSYDYNTYECYNRIITIEGNNVTVLGFLRTVTKISQTNTQDLTAPWKYTVIKDSNGDWKIKEMVINYDIFTPLAYQLLDEFETAMKNMNVDALINLCAFPFSDGGTVYNNANEMKAAYEEFFAQIESFETYKFNNRKYDMTDGGVTCSLKIKKKFKDGGWLDIESPYKVGVSVQPFGEPLKVPLFSISF